MYLSLFCSVFIIFITYLIHKFIIKPLLSIHFYKKQGFKLSFFYPLFGFSQITKRCIEKHNDYQYYRKHLLVEYPGTKGIVTNIFDKACLVLADTSMKRDFFLSKQHFYVKDPQIINHFKMDIKKNEENIFLAEGKSWKRIRRIISKTFHYDFIISTSPLIQKITDELFEKMNSLGTVNLMNEFKTITGYILLKTMFGEDFLEYNYQGMTAPVAFSKVMMDVIVKRFSFFHLIFGRNALNFLFPTFKKCVQSQKEFNEKFLMKYIRQKFEEFKLKKRKNSDLSECCLLDSMFRLVLKEEDDFILEEILSNMIILFLGGSDSTANLLAHSILMLSENPLKYKILMDEIEDNTSNIDKTEYDSVKNLEYLNGVIKETMRIVGLAADISLRQAKEDHKLGDVLIKKGTNIYLGFSINFFDPSIFKNPYEFLPERWIKNHELFDNAEEKDPYCYLPFSSGSRNCIGQHMAIFEAKIILVKFLRRFEFGLNMKKPITWISRFAAETKEPLIANLKPRVCKKSYSDI